MTVGGTGDPRYRALAIIERAHRGAVEAQFTGPLYLARGLGAQLDGPIAVVLRGVAVTLAVAGGHASALHLGDRSFDTLPDPASDIRALLDRDGQVYVITQDCALLAVPIDRMVDGVVPIDAGLLPDLVECSALVWFL